jgi:hypothetical protein
MARFRWAPTAAVCSSARCFDVEQLKADLLCIDESFGGATVTHRIDATLRGAGFRVDLAARRWLRRFLATGVRRGARIDCNASLPAFLMAPTLPAQRGARVSSLDLFGGDGWAPQLVKDSRRRKSNAPEFRVRSVQLMQHCRDEHPTGHECLLSGRSVVAATRWSRV